jgi:putative Mn2+ efflux pump MntP
MNYTDGILNGKTGFSDMNIHNIWGIILLCISMSIHNFLIGLHFSVNGKNIPILGVSLISFINAFSAFITMFFGIIILKILPLSICLKISAFIFFWLAYKESREFFYVDKNDPNSYKNISWIDIYLLGLAVCLTSFAEEVAKGITGVSMFKPAFICFIISYIFLELGVLIGNKIGKSLILNKRNISLVSAIGFFLIGINNLL